MTAFTSAWRLQLGPLRNIKETAEISGCLSGAGLIFILTVCLSMYGATAFQGEGEEVFRLKTLSGRELPPDPLQSTDGCALSASMATLRGA